MRIDIWSDVVCPWCYIGKRRLESALADFGRETEVVWHAFQLDPAAPTEPTQTVVEHLAAKYGGGSLDKGRQMVAHVEELAAGEGLRFDHAAAPHANTLDAHRLLHLALLEGGPEVQSRLKDRLLAAYFTDARNPADRDLLAGLAADAGLRAERVAEVLGSEEYADAVAADIAQARALGATGVPFFVIDEKYGVSGAQSTEVFAQVLERAWSERQQVVTMVAGGPDRDGGTDACGPDGCPI